MTFCPSPVAVFPVVALVILDIAAPDVDFRISILKFFEDGPGVLAHDIGQHIETAPVGHADDDMDHSLAGRLFDGLIEQRDEGFRTLQGKRFGSDEFFLDKVLKHHRIGQSLQDPDLLLSGELDAVSARFHPRLQPFPLVQGIDMHELHADVTRCRSPGESLIFSEGAELSGRRYGRS